MKRDWDLVREILLKLEKMESTCSALSDDSIEGYEPEIVSYHMHLLDEAGLIEASCYMPLSGAIKCSALRVTWNGHEFLDKVSKDTIWNSTKKLIKEKGVDLSFETIKYAATVVLKSVFE